MTPHLNKSLLFHRVLFVRPKGRTININQHNEFADVCLYIYTACIYIQHIIYDIICINAPPTCIAYCLLPIVYQRLLPVKTYCLSDCHISRLLPIAFPLTCKAQPGPLQAVR